MSYEELLEKVFLREPNLKPTENDFWPFQEAYEKTLSIVSGFQGYMEDFTYKQLCINLLAHYIITTRYFYEDEEGEKHLNPLYVEYDIANKKERGLVSSASDESSSASILTFESLNKGDFLMQDLMLTTYGREAYLVLEQLSIMPILL